MTSTRRTSAPATDAAKAVVRTELVPVLLRTGRDGITLPVPAELGPVGADEVRQRTADRRLERPAGLVDDDVAEDGDRDPAGFGIGGDERVPGLEPHVHGGVRIGQQDLAERVGGREGDAPEPGQAVVDGRRAVRGLVGGERQGAFEGADERRPFAGDAQGEEGPRLLAAPRDVALGRPVHDLPIDKVAAAAERDGARADAAEGQRDPLDVVPVVGSQNGPVRPPAIIGRYGDADNPKGKCQGNEKMA